MMKKIQLFLLLNIVISYFNIHAQDIQVGNGICGSSSTSSTPVKYDNGSWNSGKSCSWTMAIYTKDELENKTGNITTIGYFPDCSRSSKTFNTVSNQRIYIKEIPVTQSVITNTSIPDLTTFTKVFDGDITWKYRNGPWDNAKTDIEFTTAFPYSGTKNILVYFENESEQGLGWSGVSFIWNNKGNNRVAHTLYKKSDKSTSIGTLANLLPVTYFKIEPSTTPTVPEITLESDKAICREETYTFTTATSVSGYPSPTLKWTTSGNGSFNNDTNINPTYTPSITDKNNGSVTLTLKATNSQGSNQKTFTLTLKSFPDATIKVGP